MAMVDQCTVLFKVHKEVDAVGVVIEVDTGHDAVCAALADV